MLTGAGISAESGVPTFRGDGGLWKEYKAEDLATTEAFLKDPRLVWEWYNWRREVIAKALPNAAHKALVQLEIKKREYTLITQNVDGLHDRAGSGRMLKLHGDIWRAAPTGRTGARRCPRFHPTALAAVWRAPAWSGSASRFPTA